MKLFISVSILLVLIASSAVAQVDQHRAMLQDGGKR
jgi:hypothetical protein